MSVLPSKKHEWSFGLLMAHTGASPKRDHWLGRPPPLASRATRQESGVSIRQCFDPEIHVLKRICIHVYIYIDICSRRPSSPAPPPPPPQWYGSIQGGGPCPPRPRPPQGGGACGAACSSVRATLWARLRRCSCDALQCDLLILQHATSCSAVAIDSARCHDAVCGLQRHNQVPTKCAATRQWQTHFACYPSGRCGNHGRGVLCGHTVLPFSPPPIPTGGRPPHPSHRGRGACTLCYLLD